MIDPSIPLQAQPPKFNNPFEVLGQYRQLQQQREEAEQRKKLIAQQIQANEDARAKEQRQQEQGTFIADAYRQAFNPETGQVDRGKLSQALTQAGLGPALPDLLKGLDDAEKANLDVQNAKAKAKQDTDAAEMAYAKYLGSQILAADFNPQIVNGLFAVAESHGHDVRQFQQLYTDQPEQFKTFVSNLVNPPKPTEPFTLNPGQVRFGPDGQPLANVPPEQQGFTLNAGDVRYGPDGHVIASRPAKPETPQAFTLGPGDVRYGPDGRVVASVAPSAASGKSAPGTVSAVIDSLDELSKRINVEGGMAAKASGLVRRGMAAANEDDDVAEYQAIVESFVPTIARALGHTGVLTQLDVDSAKAILPKPGDSKSMRDRKMARIRDLFSSQLQPESAGVVPPPGATILRFDAQGNVVK